MISVRIGEGVETVQPPIEEVIVTPDRPAMVATSSSRAAFTSAEELEGCEVEFGRLVTPAA